MYRHNNLKKYQKGVFPTILGQGVPVIHETPNRMAKTGLPLSSHASFMGVVSLSVVPA